MNATAINRSLIIVGLIALTALIGSSGARAAGSKQVSTPPLSDSSQTVLNWDEVDTLSWYYASVGDYNQDSEVGMPDITMVGIHFKEEGPFTYESVQGVIDADQNDEINGADLVNIARYMGSRTVKYNVYTSLDQADYPESNDGPNGAGATPLGAVLFEDASGGFDERKQFSYTVAAPQADAYYWVRPVDADSAEGTPSTLAGGPEAQQPILALTNPPFGGNGTSSNPYIADIDVDYVFSLTDAIDGDVSTDPNTEYHVSNSLAGSISNTDATLNIEDDFAGPFNVTATYNEVPNRADTTVYMFVLPIPPG